MKLIVLTYTLTGLLSGISGFSFSSRHRPRAFCSDRTVARTPPTRPTSSGRSSTSHVVILHAEPEKKSGSGSKPKKEKDQLDETIIAIKKIGDYAFTASLELLSYVRWGAANALTSSLPEKQRNDLLNRMTKETPKTPLAQDEALDRGSIQEEIAVAVAKEARVSKERWEEEKDQITKQIEDAANERVKNELAIQKKRLEDEKKEVIEKMETKQAGASTVETLLKKREQQEAELRAVENKLRNRVNEIALEKKKIFELEEDIERLREKQAAAKEAATAAKDVATVPYYTPREYRALSDEEKAKLKEQREALGPKVSSLEVKDEDAHPVLGPVVSNLGYKRIHFVSSGKLGTIPVWNRNRIYRNTRARSMAADKTKSMHLGFPGVICLYEDVNGKLSILDGQHRVGMMAALREMRNKEAMDANKTLPDDDYMFEQVLVEVYPQRADSNVSADEHAQEVFLEINKAEPVKLVDMPGVASAADRKVITEAVEFLQSQYPAMFSESQRCQIPNVNMDNLRNNIFGANILKRHKLKSGKKLIDWLLVQNAAVGEKYEHNESYREIINERAWTKASTNAFYLGLESSWLYN